MCPPPPSLGAECRGLGWSTHRNPPQPRPLDRVLSVEVQPAGPPSGTRHRPCRSTECRACIWLAGRHTCAHHRPGRAPSAEQPAGRHTVHHHRPGRAAKCRACKSGQLVNPPVHTATHARGRVPSALVRLARRPAVTRHCPGRSTDCQACKTGQPDNPPVPTTAQDGGKVPSVQVRLAGRPYVPHHRQGGRQNAERTSQAR